MILRYRFRLLLVFLCVVFQGILNGQAGETFILSVPKTTVSPVIDGRLDPVWRMVPKNRMLTFVDDEWPGPWPDLFTQFRALWDDDFLYLFAEVVDDRLDIHHANPWEQDGFEIYFDGDNSKNSMAQGYDDNDVQWRYVYSQTTGNPGAPGAVHAWLTTDHGCNFEIRIPRSSLPFGLEAGHVFGHEWQYNDNDGGNRETIAKWWSSSDDSWRDPSLFGTAGLGEREVSSALDVHKTELPPEIDGLFDAVWETAPEIPFNTYVEDWGPPVRSLSGWDDLDMTFRILWDDHNLYLFVSVIDDVVATPNSAEYQNDGIELSFDGDNSKNNRYDANDRRYTFVYGSTPNPSTPPNAPFAWNRTGMGYDFELRIPAQDLTFPLNDGHEFGFEVQINDNDGGDREHVAKWWSSSDETWVNPSLFGTARLVSVAMPRVVLTAPAAGAVFSEGDAVPLAAQVVNVSEAVSSVTFFVDDRVVARDEASPYAASWTAERPGTRAIRAEARLSSGGLLRSTPVSVIVIQKAELTGTDSVNFSLSRGFYNEPFDVVVYSALPGAGIRYTLDGSDPRESPSAFSGDSPESVRIDPSSMTGRGRTPAVVLRASATSAGRPPTRPVTQTYIFINRVRSQSHPGGGWPSGWFNGQIMDYDMDPSVVNDPRYGGQIEAALLDIPTFSLVTDPDHLFAPDSGIYVNAQYHGRAWERPSSVELIHPDGTEGFSVPAGLRIRGGWSRHGDNPKHAFRLFFRREYGMGKLNYPLFGNEGVGRFDKIDLRTSQNYSWSYKGDSGSLNTMNRDVFSRDLQGELGRPYTRSRYYHLYLNGLYMGLFQTQERPEASFAEQYLGGDRENWDVVKVDIGDNWEKYDIEATDGNLDAWLEVWEACLEGFQENAAYFRLQGKNPDGTVNPLYSNLVDIGNLIDYMLIIFYTGNYDAPVSRFRGNNDPNNFYALRDRTGRNGFIFLANDSEHSLLPGPSEGSWDGVYENRVNLGYPGGPGMWVGLFEKFHPQWLHFRLAQNAEYRMQFADQAFRHLFFGGAMTPEPSINRFRRRADEIDLAIVAESARWGDSKWHTARTKHDDWIPAVNGVIQEFFPHRTDIVIDQLRAVGLYPEIDPPVFVLHGESFREDRFVLTTPADLQILNPGGQTGTLYVTRDGSDPRAIGGAVSPSAEAVSHQDQIALNGSLVLSARVRVQQTWSALRRLTVRVPGVFDSLKITELHYHPLGGDDGTSHRDLEFVELKNTGGKPLDLSGVSFVSGIRFTFPDGSGIAGGAFKVLASNADAFLHRYGFAPFGEYEGQLDNGGETVTLSDASGDTIFSLTYSDRAPWPSEADGGGYSLVSVERNPSGSPDDPRYWRASHNIHGSPGADEGDGPSDVAQIPDCAGRFGLHQNSPNPFNPATEIIFELPERTFVTLSIYDLLGRRIETLVQASLDGGIHRIRWDGSRFAAGIYICELVTPVSSYRRKMLLVK